MEYEGSFYVNQNTKKKMGEKSCPGLMKLQMAGFIKFKQG